MRLLPLFGALALVAASGLSAARAEPGGCLKYGAVGAVGGHLMHHGVLGAAGGCAAGMYKRHEYRKHLKEMQEQQEMQEVKPTGSGQNL
jgi:hypothetical protein